MSGREDIDNLRERLVELVAKLTSELHGVQSEEVPLFTARLNEDLGIDSLSRAELISRIERDFKISLPEKESMRASTIKDLLALMEGVPEKGVRPQLQRERVQVEDRTHLRVDPEAETVAAALLQRAESSPQRIHLVLLDEDGQRQDLSYGELLSAALAAAGGITAHGVKRGDRVAIILPTCRDFFISFCGILLAGAVPVPLYPPVRADRLEEHVLRQVKILKNAGASMLLTDAGLRSGAAFLAAQIDTLKWVGTAKDLIGKNADGAVVDVGAKDLALIQYTSGSTGDPKGVALSHGNILANLRAMDKVINISAEDVFVSWLPLYHDMGLIGAWLGSLFFGTKLVIMSPLSFLARPRRWLDAIHTYSGTLSAAPNFAYELCAAKIPESDLEGLDLSSWRIAFNGAEPISADTLARFSRRFSSYGLRSEALTPVYGLAENCLGVAFSDPKVTAPVDQVERESLQKRHFAKPAGNSGLNPIKLVSCGKALPGHELRIVGHDDRELEEREEGRVQFRGPSATSGYFNNPEATKRLISGDWRETGDLGYLAQRQLYITGRQKEVIIRGGRNIHPAELEAALGEIVGVRKGCAAVFGVNDGAGGTERLIAAVETRLSDELQRADLRSQIREKINLLTGLAPDEVLLLSSGSVPKTSSGKIRRNGARELYERGILGHRRAAWLQFIRLAVGGTSAVCTRFVERASAYLYCSYCYLVFLLLALPVWLAIILLPKQGWRRRAARFGARVLFYLVGASPKVDGREYLGQSAQLLIASNHQSYLDVFVLAAVLPPYFAFVAKRELSGSLFLSSALRRLGTLFVDRFEGERGVADSTALVQSLKRGESLVFFPEGTFIRSPGLLPFRMGAFVAAAQSGVPLIPVGIRGTRSALRAQSWFVRRARITVSFGPATRARSADWESSVELRAAVRPVISELSGESGTA